MLFVGAVFAVLQLDPVQPHGVRWQAVPGVGGDHRLGHGHDSYRSHPQSQHLQAGASARLKITQGQEFHRGKLSHNTTEPKFTSLLICCIQDDQLFNCTSS